MIEKKIGNNNKNKMIRNARIALAGIALGGLGLAGCSKPEVSKPTQEIIINPARTTEATKTPTIIVRTPEVTAKNESNFTFKKLQKGDVWNAQPGDVAIGEMEFNDEITYDKLEGTGLITRLLNATKVTARKNAGVVIHPVPGADVNAIIAEQERLMKAANPQIKTVDKLVFPGETQRQLAEPVPTQAPRTTTVAPTPVPTEAPGQIEDKGIDVIFARNETKIVSSAVLSGDFRLNGVNGIKMHDDRGDTGAILMIEGQAAIFSEFGGSGNANFRTQAGLETKTREILLQKLTEFREVTVNEINRDGKLISSITYTRDGLLIDNLVDIRTDRIVLLNGQVIFQNNAGINFDNRREDRRQDRRQDRRNP